MPRPSSSASASAIIAGPMSGYHVLKIVGYSFTKAVATGKHIVSRPFLLAGHSWCILYYPNGDRRDAADYVSLFLLLIDRDSETFAVDLSFSIIDPPSGGSGDVDHQKSSPSISFRSSKKVERLYPCCPYGFWKFIKRDDLERSGWLKDDSFTVRCDVTVSGKIQAVDATLAVVVPSSAARARAAVVPPPPDWPQHFRALLESGQGADVRFLVEGGRTFAAHRCVLAARSPVFRAELYGGMKESVDTARAVQVDDMRADVFENLLHFIYTDSLPPPESTAAAAEVQDQEEDGMAMAQHLLVAADRYGMERLKVMCEDKLCRLVDVSSAGTLLLLAEQHRCKRLKEACLEFLSSSKTLSMAAATDGFKNLAKTFPFILFDLIAKLEAR